MTDDLILEMHGITKEFPGVKALSDVTFRVRRGEIHAICGENGAGKSTLMKVLSGVHPHGSYTGQIFLDGAEVRFANIRASEKAGIAIIHQELALIPELTITENLFLGNEVGSHGIIDWRTANVRARALLERVGLHDDPDTKIRHLGVGKQQLVEIAKALAKDARLLILDEPTAALNENDSQLLLSLLKELQAEGMTSVIISHKLAEITQVADSITIIRDGRTIETLDVAAGGVDEDRIIRGMVGRSLGHRFPDRDVPLGDVRLAVHGWTVAHPVDATRLVCKGIDLQVRAGEVVGLAGLMGAGRTELAMSIFGRSYGTYRIGELEVSGRRVVLHNVAAAIKAGLAYVSEDRKGLGLNMLDDVKRTTVAAKLGKITRHGVLQPPMEREAAERYVRELHTKTPSVDYGVEKLSGGNQQKVVLAKWMFTDPDVLILDEPTRGIDVGAKYEIYTIINELAAQGKAILLISSELPELLGVADRIYTICEGAVTANLPARDADQETLMRHMTDYAAVNRRLKELA